MSHPVFISLFHFQLLLMKNQTVVGIFNTATDAQNAVKQLAAAGFELDFVDVSQASSSASGTSDNYANTSGTATEAVGDAAGRTKDKVGGFFSSLFGDDNDEADTYAEVTRSGHSLVTVHVDTAEQAHKAADILDNAGALDVDSKAAEYGVSNSYTAGRAAAAQPHHRHRRPNGPGYRRKPASRQAH